MDRLSDEQILVYAYLVTCLLGNDCVKDYGNKCKCDVGIDVSHCARLPEQVRFLHEVLSNRLGKETATSRRVRSALKDREQGKSMTWNKAREIL